MLSSKLSSPLVKKVASPMSQFFHKCSEHIFGDVTAGCAPKGLSKLVGVIEYSSLAGAKFSRASYHLETIVKIEISPCESVISPKLQDSVIELPPSKAILIDSPTQLYPCSINDPDFVVADLLHYPIVWHSVGWSFGEIRHDDHHLRSEVLLNNRVLSLARLHQLLCS
ncbi:hypothetical protein BDV36DRAFT_86788 [Aspergillus pseudocaelatus]|uniref:Uncharacterized protein n=1 Tax=Aspergillus pseudocaelatus TaxID=1825620 RepID=A0ABQ6WWB4_9EURO|nr:hypothetical protein BDV36DRAFT_86788 [Aspergillus pseudocaelatus]